MPSPLADKLPAALRGRLGLTLVALVGAGLAITIAGYLRFAENRVIRQEIERRVSLRHDLLRQNLHEYDSALFALRLLFDNSRHLTPEEFQHAATETFGRVPGIQAVQWVPRVPAPEIGAFVDRARALVSPEFSPHQRRPDDSLAPLVSSSSRASHALVTYIHPLRGNESALGYDIFTAPSSPDLARAADHPGRIVLSRAFRLVQGGEGVVFATYIDRGSDASAPAPLSGPGFLQIVLRLDAVLDQAWNVTNNPILDVMLVDATDAPVHLFTQIGATRQNATLKPPPPDFSTPDTHVRDFPLGGRVWRACYRPRDDWIDSHRNHAPLLSLIGTLLLTAVSVAYLRTILRQNDRIRRVVAQRTAELNESRALLDEIIDHNPSSIWVKDTAFRYQLVNLSFCACYGRPRADILGRTDEGLHAPDTVVRMEQLDARILATGETVSFEESYPMPSGPRTYLVSKFPVRRADDTICAVAGIATDITDLRDAEAKQRAIERKLRDAQKLESLGLLAGGVAHDFNNLLTGILGHAGLARALLAPDHPAQTSLAQIETASHRAADLCRQMLAYSGSGRIAVQPVELGELVRDTVNLLKLSLARGARLHLDLAPDLPFVVADLVQIRQIAMNLVLNASEALRDGQGDITLRTRLVRADAALFAACVFSPDLPPGDYACLEVADTGHGMTPETLARIFDPFFSTKFTGRGLGLAAVLGIVRGHRGALRVSSRPGAGTTFHLYLPVAAGSAHLSPPPAENVLPGSPPGPARLRLLLVDDEAAVRETVAPLLESCGHAVDVCPDGETGLKRFRAAPGAYDAAIVDLTMPGIGGARLFRSLREIEPGLPVLLISGYAEPDAVAANLLDSPRVAFLPKPFTLAALSAKLSALLAS